MTTKSDRNTPLGSKQYGSAKDTVSITNAAYINSIGGATYTTGMVYEDTVIPNYTISPQGEPLTALNKQVSGSHYKNFKIQPIEFIHANNIPFSEANVIKYVCRWREKDGIKDLEKAKHYIELLIELELKK